MWVDRANNPCQAAYKTHRRTYEKHPTPHNSHRCNTSFQAHHPHKPSANPLRKLPYFDWNIRRETSRKAHHHRDDNHQRDCMPHRQDNKPVVLIPHRSRGANHRCTHHAMKAALPWVIHRQQETKSQAISYAQSIIARFFKVPKIIAHCAKAIVHAIVYAPDIDPHGQVSDKRFLHDNHP